MSVEKIGRYQIDGELGKGAMGVVYKATDPNIGRTVALKTMRVDVHGLEHDEMVRRFQNEARAAGVLNHPNIVTIYDAGEDNGIFYIAMEYIEGQTLSAVLQQKRSLMASEVVDIGTQICGGLQYAHIKKVVHRDIKPANIMIGPTGTVKIMDFGIAKAGASLTHTGEVVGTPNYMSPEQVKGRDLDGRSDLFSCGVMLYEMLTGERPFTGQSVTTIIYKIVNENPIPPRELDVSIHPGLSMIVTKCLSKDPDDRYQEAGDLATALKSYRIISVPDQGAYATGPMPMTPTTGVITKPVTPPTAAPTGVGVATARTSPTIRSAMAAQQQSTSPDAPTFVGNIAQERIRQKPNRTWMLVSALALIVVFGVGIVRTLKRPAVAPQNTTTETSSSTTQTPELPAQAQTSPPSAPAAPAQPKQESPEERITKAAQEIASRAQKSAMDAETKAAESKAKAIPDVDVVGVGDLRITSTPPGAKVMIDGVAQDYYVTPFNSPPLKAGTHSLIVSSPGLPGQTRQVEVAAHKRTPIDFQLAGDNAIYNITSAPSGAEILIDGTPTGSRTPAQIPLKAGKHRIVFRLDGFQPLEMATESSPGQSVNLAPQLVARNSVDITGPKPPDQPSLGALARMRRFFGGGEDLPAGKGAILIRTRPKGATITVDGIAARRTTPFRFPMHPGTYNVVITKQGFDPVRKTVVVEEGKVAEVDALLVPKGK